MHKNNEFPQWFGPWRKDHSALAYENPWIQVFHEQVTTPAGTPGIYGRVHFKGQAVAVIPFDAQAETVLVKQYRYTLAEPSFEVPMGGCGRNESVQDCAHRELEEETGLKAERLVKLGEYHTSNSITDEKGTGFLALDLSQGQQQLEASESDLECIHVSFQQAIEWVDAGKITDAISVAALLQAEKWLIKQGLLTGA